MRRFIAVGAIILAAQMAFADDLFQAIEAKDIQRVKTELSKANVNSPDEHGTTPLIAAAGKGQYEICQVLLGAGADPAQKDSEGFTALDHVDILLRVASDDHKRGITMLQSAGITNFSTIPVERIKPIDTGALVRVRGLLLAHSEQSSAVSAPSAAGADQWSEDQKTMERIIASGFDVNSSKGDGITPLMHAAAEGNYELCRFLIEHGAKTDVMDNTGRSVRDHVCTKKGDEATKDKINALFANPSAAGPESE